MTRTILLGTALSVCVAGSASALTMTPLSDGRSISATAAAGFDSDSDSSSPSAGFPVFDDFVDADASELLVARVLDGGNGGAYAASSAGQESSIGSLSISGSGDAYASGESGYFQPVSLVTDGGLFGGNFEATAESVLEIMFSIDEEAAFDLSGFLYAGVQILKVDEDAGGLGTSGMINSASMRLFNSDTNAMAFETEVVFGSQNVDESGLIGPGNYTFSVIAYAEVFGVGLFEDESVGDALIGLDSTSAGFSSVNLELSAVDRPIPEPVTTSLIGMGLGALCFATYRRRA